MHECTSATSDASLTFDKTFKESSDFLSSIWDIFEFTFNKEGLPSHSQKETLRELPTQGNLNKFKPIKILLVLPSCKEVSYNEGMDKEYFLIQVLLKLKLDARQNA